MLFRSILIALLLCGQTIYVTQRHPEPTTDSGSDGDGNGGDSNGDGCTTGDGGEF